MAQSRIRAMLNKWWTITCNRRKAAALVGVLAASLLLSALAIGAAAQTRETPEGSVGPAAFTDASEIAGIADTHKLPPKYITGQAWGDYDQDGWPDLYVSTKGGSATLYHNEGDGTFSVSPLSDAVSPEADDKKSGGAVFADYDNDGWPDLYVANAGLDVLFHNEGGEGFTDVTDEAGISDGGRGTTASWGDYDNDGYLDLYVANYGSCKSEDCAQTGDMSEEAVGTGFGGNSPDSAEGDQDRLYHNNGDGTFTNVTAALPTEKTLGFGFVAGWLDYDNDSDLDVYLVNDVLGTRYAHPNALFRNDGPGCKQWCFTDVSEASGAGVRMDGMGLAVGDYDGDQNLDLYVSNTGWALSPLTGPAVLLGNRGDGTFEDVAQEVGAGVDAVGWGTVFLDYDNDGWQDLYLALGWQRLYSILDETPPDGGQRTMQDSLLRNRGDGTFEDKSAASGSSLDGDTYGVATADYNNDGWPDLVVGNMDEGYDLYANTGAVGEGNQRLVVRLRGDGPVNRDAVGARVYLTTTDGRTQLKEVMAGSSLGAGNDLALGFGLGEASVESLRVLWPDGTEETFSEVPSDVLWQLNYGDDGPSTSQLAEAAVPRAEPEATQEPISGGVRLGGYFVPALGLLATLGLVGWLLARRLGFLRFAPRLLVALVVGVLCFQLGHFFEHLLQLGYWFLHPREGAWITPWGRVATDGLAAVSGHHGGRATGTELLHMAANWITFVGILAMYLALRGWGVGARQMRFARIAFWVQLVHVLEHVSLMTTFFTVGLPIGISTLFGYSFHFEGAWASSIRIWWHFAMALVPTVAYVLALREFRRERPRAIDEPTGTASARHEEAPEEQREEPTGEQKIPVGQGEPPSSS